MNTRKLFLIAFLVVAMLSSMAKAQGLFGKLKDAVLGGKAKAQEKAAPVVEKVEEVVEEAAAAAEEVVEEVVEAVEEEVAAEEEPAAEEL